MFKWLFCEHDFQIIDTTYDIYYDSSAGKHKNWKRYILYCPKCDREKRVDADRYDLKEKKKRIKEDYMKENKLLDKGEK